MTIVGTFTGHSAFKPSLSRFARGVLALLSTAAALTSAGARADQCLKGPARITGLPGAPEWQDFDGDNFWRPELHDPRWASVSPQMLTFTPSATGPLLESAASVRALVLNDVLYLAAYVEDDPNGPTQADTLHVGFTEGGTDTGHVFKIELACGSLTPIGAPSLPTGSSFPEAPADPDAPRILNASVVQHWHSNNAREPAPEWIHEAASSSPEWSSLLQGACWDRATTSSPRWAVTLRIALPVGSGQDTDVFVGVSTSSGTSPNTVTRLANVPPASGAEAVGSTLAPKSARSWEHYTTDTTSAESPCRNGLVVSKNDLGVWLGEPGNATGGTLVDEVCAGGACGSGDNIVRITARQANREFLPWEVRARFRISDWGSSADNREFGTWQDVWALNDGTRPNPLTVDSSVLRADSRWHFFATPTSVLIDFECQRGSDEYCPKLQSGDHNKQSFLVEIARSTSAGQRVRVACALRNMRYRNLSVADEQASISVAGLEEVLGNKDPREVYLQVVARNMQAHDSKPQWLEHQAMEFSKRISETPVVIDSYQPKVGSLPPPRKPGTVDGPQRLKGEPKDKRRGGKDDYGGLAHAETQVAKAHAKTVAALALDNTQLVRGVEKHEALAMTEDQLLDAVWPTYRVRAFYVRGRELGPDGIERTLLVPMPSFGLRLNHQGPLYGFGYTLKDENNQVIAPINGTSNWFKLTIPNEGRRNVRLGVVAEEAPKVLPEPTPLPVVAQPPPLAPRGCGRCNVGSNAASAWAALGVLVALTAAFVGRRRHTA